MALVSMFLLAVIIAAAVCGGMSLAGIVTLVVTAVNNNKRRRMGVPTKSAGFVIGGILVGLPVVLTVLLLVTGVIAGIKQRAEAESYGDDIRGKWQNVRTSEDQALEDCMTPLLEAAEAGDAEKLKACFPVSRQGAELDRQAEEFIANFPKGLSGGEIDMDRPGMSGGTSNGKTSRVMSSRGEIRLNGEIYYINVIANYINDEDPDKVGVTVFSVESEVCCAERRQSEKFFTESTLLRCAIEPEDPTHDSRRIDGMAYLYEDTGKRDEAEMLKVLETERSMAGLKAKFGEPNASYKMANSNGTDHFYELESEGEPRYFHIEAVDDKIIIDLCFTCGTEDDDYELWLDDDGKPKER